MRREPDLLADVRSALADEHPLGLLALVSSLLAVIDPRKRSPLERSLEPERGGLSGDELIRSFIGVDRIETTALLAVIAQMSPDELLGARARRELGARSHVLPPWLARLGEADAYRTLAMVHILGDGDNVMIGVRLPGAQELAVVVYIDHNLGTVVKDAFVIPEPLAELIELMRTITDDPDTTCDDIDRADARARIADAIDLGAITFPPFETDTWPACRPLVEWAMRLLPAGGRGYERPDWDEAALEAIAGRFFESPFAAGVDDDDYRGLLDSLLWFGTDYGPGDPLRWSPVAVEIVLIDWIPRKLLAPAAYLAKVPALLRAFIRYCHREQGIGEKLTAQTLAAVDDWEPEYYEVIRSPRPPDPAVLLPTIGMLDSDDLWSILDDVPPYKELMLDTLRSAVGGDDELDALDDHPLPDEPFSWSDIPTDVHERVAEVLTLVDRCCDEMLDVEHRTACRRFLTRVTAGNPDVFRRRARANTAAAAVCWTVGKANDLFSPSGRYMQVKDLMAHFGLPTGSVSQRAATLLRAGGFARDHYRAMDLGSPEYLVSSRRRRILDLRDRYRAMPDG